MTLDPLGDSARDPVLPYGLVDLMKVTGWSHPTAAAAMRTGVAPGYQAVEGGKWIIPAEAFRAFCRGEWQPQPRPVSIVTPITPIRKRAVS